MQKINIRQWTAERNRVEQRIKDLKRCQRESGRPHWVNGASDRALLLAKHEATILYILRADCRNPSRVHTTRLTPDRYRDLLERGLAWLEAAANDPGRAPKEVPKTAPPVPSIC